MLVHGRGDGEVGDGAQRCHVEQSVVCGTVLAHQSCPVETEHHGQVEYRHVVDDIVVGPLGERTVDVAEGDEPILRHTCGEGDGVSLGDAHVEGAVGHCLHHDVHGATGRHGGCHAHNLGVLSCKLQEGLSEDILEFGRLVGGVGGKPFAGLGVELARCVPYGGTLLGGLVALALGGVQVEQLGALHVLQLPQHPHDVLHVVAVERTEVADVHALEDVLLVAQCRLQGVVEPQDAFLAVVVEVALGVQPLRCLEAQLVVGLVGVEVEEVFLHSSYGAVDAHVVVVEHDEHVVGGTRHVVESLESQSAAHRPVADYCHDAAVAVASLLGGDSHS